MINSLIALRAEPLPLMELAAGTSLNERYHEAITQVMSAASAIAPEVIGMTVFGSLSRDEAKVKEDDSVSDVDGVVVIDATGNKELADFVGLPEWRTAYATLGMTSLGMEVKVQMQDLIKETAGTGAEPDLDLLLISNKQLLDTPRRLIGAATEPEGTVSDWANVDVSTKQVLRYFIGRDQAAGLFFPTAYGDLASWRGIALKPLAEYRDQKPQITARIWDNIKVYTNHFMKGRDGGDSAVSNLPENIDEAIQEYKA